MTCQPRLVLILRFLVLVCLSSTIYAKPITDHKSGSFRVEIVIFENLDSPPSSESWQTVIIPAPPLVKNNRTGWDANDMNDDNLELKQIARKIERSSHYRLVSYYTWLQRQAITRNIYETTTETGAISNAGTLVEGKLKIQPGYYYLVDVDLSIQAKHRNIAPPLRQIQKVKANKLYYLDSPRLGMLVMISPI